MELKNESCNRRQLRPGRNGSYDLRQPTTLENQPVIRMNQDTLYSATVLDQAEPVQITLLEVGGRYMSMHVSHVPAAGWDSRRIVALPRARAGRLTRRKKAQPSKTVRPLRRHSRLAACTRKPFCLTLRIHWPVKAALDGSWTPPPVVRVA